LDGVWWPASRELAVELPAVFAELAAHMGVLERVSYHLAAWPANPRKINVSGAVVRLSGFRTQHHDMVDLVGARYRLVILVVAPETDPETAREVITSAGRDGNIDDIRALLTAHGEPSSSEPAAGSTVATS
jgi:hypothetical protein